MRIIFEQDMLHLCRFYDRRSDEVTLDESLASLAAAGWPDAHIFAEPESPLPRDVEPSRVTIRKQQLGAWPNWLLSLTEMMLRDPHADAYMMSKIGELTSEQMTSLMTVTMSAAAKCEVDT